MKQRSQLYLRSLAIVLFLCLLLPSISAGSEDGDTAPPISVGSGRQVPTQEQIQERISALEQSTQLNESVRNQALGLYRSAAERLAAAENHLSTANRYRQAIDTAPEQTQRLRERLSQARAAHTGEPEQLPPRSDTKALLVQRRAELSALQNRLKELDDQLRAQQSRPLAIREELASARSRRDQAELELQAPLGESESERLREARLASIAALRHASNAQISMLEQELLSHDARITLLAAQRDLISFQVQRESERLRQIQEQANLQSRAEAAQAAEAAERAKREAWGSHAVLMDVAQVNSQLSRQLSELVAQIERTSSQQTQIGQQLDQINKSYRNTRQQLEIAGLSDALGAALRQERRALPDLNQSERTERQNKQRITDARLAQFQIEQQRRDLDSPALRVAALMEARVDGELAPDRRQQIQTELERLVEDQNSLLNELAANYNRHIELLADLNRDQRELSAQAAQYGTLLDESLFWIASSSPIGLKWPQELAGSTSWLLDDRKWSNVGKAAAEGLKQNPLISLLALFLFGLLLRGRRDIRDRLHTAASHIGKVHSDRFSYTVKALLATPALALPWPLLLYLLGWLVTRPLEMSPFVVAVGQSLQYTAVVAFVIESFRQLCRPEGLAQAHFHWSEHSRQLLRRNLTWLLAISLPATFVISLTEWLPDAQHRDALGRLAFLVFSLSLSVFARRILHPQHGALMALRGEHLQGSWWWLRYLGYPLAVATPLFLAAMALYGYHYTALQLQSRLFTTGWLLVGAGILFNMGTRWLNVMERRLALIRARARREALLAEREAAKEAGNTLPPEPIPEAEEEEAALDTIDDQNRGLLNLAVVSGVVIGLWLIWSDLMPALNIFNEIVLWQHSAADGERVVPITLVDLILAAAVGGFTAMAARNIPGILEISVLPKLSIDAGARYAITAVSRYLIVTAGLIGVVAMLGISWTKAQWLVAALGLGLGFGLQEIFANFVSGLIILFERPIRVGDTVTVGELSGTVTRIRIRATTITDWDKREIIIPNKTFITQELVNWTLSDHVTRVVIPICVAYHNDPEKVRNLILNTAQAHPKVLEDPEPTAFLVDFRDNALTFELRIFVQEMADRLPLGHEVRLAIVQKLRDHGIDIPYPQRDLHIRSVDPGVDLRRMPTPQLLRTPWPR